MLTGESRLPPAVLRVAPHSQSEKGATLRTAAGETKVNQDGSLSSNISGRRVCKHIIATVSNNCLSDTTSSSLFCQETTEEV